MYFYRISGLAVRSEIELPGAIASPADDGPADVAIRRDAVPAALETASDEGPNWARGGDKFLLRVTGIARFLLTGGRDIAFELDAGTPMDDVAIFLVGSVFGILLHQRGQVVLHASAVGVAGKAVLFCGPSGAGKSTLAAALTKQGYPLLNDDVCAIEFDAGRMPLLRPDGRRLKLWAQAIEKLDLAGRRSVRVRPGVDKFYVDPADAVRAPLPIAAVYALREARPPHKPGIDVPNIVDAALLARINAYRPSLVDRLDQEALYFQAGMTIANRAGMFHLTRPLDFAAMPQVVETLQRHWRSIGLADTAA